MEWLATQEEVLQYILYDPTVIAVLYYGGVGGGKTFTLCKAAVQVLEMFPGSDVLLARDTKVNLELTTLHTMWGTDQNDQPILPYGIYNEADHNQTKGFINWANNGFLAMMGLDNSANVARVKSTQWSFMGLEEANSISFKIIKFLIETRLRHRVGPRKALLTTNTDTGEDELYKFFFKTHTCDTEKFCNACPDGRCAMRRVLASTEQNYKNLPASYVKQTKFLAKSDPHYHDIYMKGKFANVSGTIFTEYSERIHILDVPTGWEPPDHWKRPHGYDHGYGGGASCMLECLIADDDTKIFWKELYLEGKERPDVKIISDKLIARNITHIEHADPAIRSNNQYKSEGEDLTSVKALFLDYGIHMELADNDVSGGIERMKTLLTPDPEHLCPVPGAGIEGLPNQPYIYILRIGGVLTCPNLNRQFKKYKNKQTVKGIEKTNSWDPVKEDDHALDPARYIVNGQPMPYKFRPPEPVQGTANWAKKLQLKKEGGGPLNGFTDEGSMRVVSSL